MRIKFGCDEARQIPADLLRDRAGTGAQTARVNSDCGAKASWLLGCLLVSAKSHLAYMPISCCIRGDMRLSGTVPLTPSPAAKVLFIHHTNILYSALERFDTIRA